MKEKLLDYGHRVEGTDRIWKINLFCLIKKMGFSQLSDGKYKFLWIHWEKRCIRICDKWFFWAFNGYCHTWPSALYDNLHI